MATLYLHDAFFNQLVRKQHNLETDSLRAILSNTAYDLATQETKADLTELTTGGGYTSNGVAITVTGLTMTGGVLAVLVSAPTGWVGSGAGFGPFQYAYLINDTSPGDMLIGVADYGSPITVGDGESFDLSPNPSLGIIRFTTPRP